MRQPPIHITFMLAIYVSYDPGAVLGHPHWNSPAGHDTRKWLLDNNLAMLDDAGDYKTTDKGKAWIDYICATPLPVQQWRLPERGTVENGA